MRDWTEKDLFVVIYLLMADLRSLDHESRIVPAIFSSRTFMTIIQVSRSIDVAARLQIPRNIKSSITLHR